ncbi:tRNA U34 5-methylaminomethyl-2-thiouridine-forming methyltransferase MnmC [Parapedobacter composti]|uniref:tRNA U34 5-methylaminomethyl-2-thiouridine-forming methyltransferase MnmC n=1 Tax=Parapedobacter composti TaxID=623281 RepID=A0A1I1DTZ8_9SPHI|nr:tRNA (5-methylaminomethyl-2-thiouridine)(34)-methyltransferase MnmD [Parapedobacter composti]SFB78509.1 tRNA U34 5-methylaminomethyl-2-thiouridine-forming methyltransferase MnmC [Parapedobacter composti]
MITFVTTADGSRTLYHPGVGEHYHSRHGAVQESRHVFLGMGLQHRLAIQPSSTVSILEIGFGTGLNFVLSADHCFRQDVSLHYTGVEACPLPEETLAQTGYGAYVATEVWEPFLRQYALSQHAPQPIIRGGTLEIVPTEAMRFTTEKRFDVLYFDAFAAVHQPEMWTAETLEHVCRFLKPGGVFVTYAITGQLKRVMRSLGFRIEKVPGAPGKREMLRAVNA